MGSLSTESAHEIFFKRFNYRIARPLQHKLGCMDVLTKELSWYQRATEKLTPETKRSIRPLVRRGSMLDKDLMAGECKWQSADAAPTCDKIQKCLNQLKQMNVKQPARLDNKEVFLKKSHPDVDLSWTESKTASAWLMDIAGGHLGKGMSFSCTMERLSSVSVDYPTLRSWIGDWRPSDTMLALESASWRRHGSKSIWIVTEVLYARKFTIKGSNGVFAGMKAQVPTTVAPGLNAGGNISWRALNDDVLRLEANRNEQFIVGFRTMRVDYKSDGTVRELKAPDDSGLRVCDVDPYQINLKSMEEDIFEVDENGDFELDEDGDKIPIQLLTPTKEEQNNLKSLTAIVKDS